MTFITWSADGTGGVTRAEARDQLASAVRGVYQPGA